MPYTVYLPPKAAIEVISSETPPLKKGWQYLSNTAERSIPAIEESSTSDKPLFDIFVRHQNNVSRSPISYIQTGVGRDGTEHTKCKRSFDILIGSSLAGIPSAIKSALELIGPIISFATIPLVAIFARSYSGNWDLGKRMVNLLLPMVFSGLSALVRNVLLSLPIVGHFLAKAYDITLVLAKDAGNAVYEAIFNKSQSSLFYQNNVKDF